MSAIYGIVNLNGAPVAREHLERMNTALAHHGADGGGIWLQANVGLGQRLMRFTSEDYFERQPFISADGSCALVSDARIDNRTELISVFGSRFSDFTDIHSQSEIPDSALILRAYETWGPDCVRHLVGVFAFAVWDTRTQTLFITRSPIVAPSLVFFSSARVFAFATMPDGLHALPFIPRALDESSLADLFVGIGDQPQATLYRAIARLPTGHRLVAGPEGVKTECYWQPDLTREIHLARDEDYWDAFNDLFARVVGDYVRSETPIAVQMSGGLDSSAVAATAARMLAPRGERLTVFTEVPRAGSSPVLPAGFYADETLFVQAIAEMYPNLELNLHRTDGQFFLNNLDRLFAYLQAPFQNTSNRVWIEAILRETSQHGMRVLLDGVQGNLTMSWNGSGLIPELIRQGKWAEAFRQRRMLTRNGGNLAAARGLIGQALLPLLPDPLWRTVDWLRHPESRRAQPWLTGSAIHPNFAAAQHVTERAHANNYAARFRPRANTRQLRYEALANQDFGAYLSAYRAIYRIDMRTPPADVRLAEWCLALPEDQYLRDGESRRLIRRAMAGQLPTNVLTNLQRGMQAADWFERLTGARALVAETLTRLEQSDSVCRVLDLKRLREMFERMPLGQVQDLATIFEYQTIFQTGLMIGCFISWFETGASGVPQWQDHSPV